MASSLASRTDHSAAAVEGYAPITPAEEAREHEGDDRREHARAEAVR